MKYLLSLIFLIVLFANPMHSQDTDYSSYKFLRYESLEVFNSCTKFKKDDLADVPGETIVTTEILEVTEEKKGFKEIKTNFTKVDYKMDGSGERKTNYRKIDAFLGIKESKLDSKNSGFKIKVRYSNTAKSVFKYSYDPITGIFLADGRVDMYPLKTASVVDKNLGYQQIAYLVSMHEQLILFISPKSCEGMRTSVQNTLSVAGEKIDFEIMD